MGSKKKPGHKGHWNGVKTKKKEKSGHLKNPEKTKGSL